MGTEGVRLQEIVLQFLQYSLIVSALIAGVVGYYTWSFKRMIVTYGVGVFFALLVAVPDWEFFKRHPWEWCIPMASDPQSAMAQKARFEILNNSPKYAQRFKFYPLRMIMFIISYGFIFYSTWKYITS